MAKDSVSPIILVNQWIGQDLKTKREQAGLSQREVARRAKMQPAVLCRLESGRSNPTVATVQRVVHAIEGK